MEDTGGFTAKEPQGTNVTTAISPYKERVGGVVRVYPVIHCGYEDFHVGYLMIMIEIKEYYT